MIRGKEMRAALAESSQLNAEREAVKRRLVAKAVADVLDGSVESAAAAARGRGVPLCAVIRALREAREKAAVAT